MKFPTKSWHYKLNNMVYPTFWGDNESLCKYFWRTMGAILILTGLILFGSVVTTLILITLSYPILQIWTGVKGVMAFSSLALWTILGIMAWIQQEQIIKIFPKLEYTLFKWRKEKTIKPEKEPSLLLSFLKAKKDKVCPLIEFGD